MTARSIETRTRHHDELAAAWERTYAAGREAVPPPFDHDADAPLSRGEADARAAWRRWHAPTQRQRFAAEQRPWYDVLERARVETLAGTDLPGMASNLAGRESREADNDARQRLYRVARQVFAFHPPTEPLLVPTSRGGIHGWSSRLVRSLISRRLDGTHELRDHDPAERQLLSALQLAAEHLDDSQGFTDGLVELIARLATYYPAETSTEADTDGSDGSDRESEQGEELAGASLADELAARDDRRQGYAVFSRQWDQERPASHWATPADAWALRQLSTHDRRRVRQLAHRLQRRLMAARQRHWQFDQEEGRLDPRRLARLVGDTPTRRVFRREQTRPLAEACVTLLVDQSGSMSGRRRHMAALAIDLAAHTLETCRIRCEVLGFTTRFAASDNPLAARWLASGMVSPPGRLNAIQHVVYKTADQPWRRVRPQLGYLLRELPGHENIDGEALHWAATRLSRRPEPHRILLVLSDGAPYDKATAQTNGRDFLERHLRHIIAEVESGPIHLAAIGTGQDVARFYQQVLTVRQPEEVAEKLFEHLGNLLVPGRTLGETS